MSDETSSTYRYRRRSPIGGLAANLTATVRPEPGSEQNALRIAGKVRLAPCHDMYWMDVSWMAYGLSLHAQELTASFPRGVLFEVNEFTYPLADYKPEVAALSIDGWLQENLGLRASPVSVEFNTELSVYEFNWPHGDPFSE